jgi:outer membrane protein TolC
VTGFVSERDLEVFMVSVDSVAMPASASRFRQAANAILFASACLNVSIAASAAEVLTFQDALRIAAERSQKLVARDAAVAAARDMAVAAGQLPDPTLKLGLNNLPINGPDAWSVTRDFMTMRSIALSQEFTREAKRKARADRFEREAEVAGATRTLALATLQRDTALAWLDRYYQERLRETLIGQRDEARLQIEAADLAYRIARGSQADVFAARASVALIDDRIAQVDRQITIATSQLARWVGLVAQQPLAAAPPMTAVRLAPADLDTQLAHHPQVDVLAKQEDVARADAQVAQANRQADWNVELMYSQRGPAYSNMVSLNVSLPLQWDRPSRQDRELAAKLALADEMRAEREDATRAHVAEASAMLVEWQSNRERLGRYENSILPLAAERTRASIAAYRSGGGTLTAILDARRGEIEIRADQLRLELDTARLWAQLNFLIPAAPGAPGPYAEGVPR